MKILTFGASPYINTNLGRINRSLLLSLKEAGHLVASAVWDHDLSWYLPDNDRYFFEHDEKQICQIYPFDNINMEASAKFMYDVIFALNPDLVITSGDIEDMEYTFAIKSLYPEKFKWIAYLAIPAFPVSENKIDQLRMIDEIFVSTKRAKRELSKAGIESEYCPFGPSDAYVDNQDNNRTDTFDVIVNAKNSTVSNIGNIFKAAGTLDKRYSIYLHTNYSDPGEYDIDLLKSRYDKHDIIRLPEEFVGLNEGIPDEDLKSEYSKADAILDVSARSATGLTTLEAMRMGCIPLISQAGALGEIYNKFAPSQSLMLHGHDFISYGETELCIVGSGEIHTYLNLLRHIKQESPEELWNLMKEAKRVANGFSEKELSLKILKSLKRIFSSDKELKIETF